MNTVGQLQLKSVEGLSGWSYDMLSVPDQQGTLRSIGGKMVSGDALGMLDVRPYLGRGTKYEFPVCPAGGVYTIGAVGEKPTCSIAGHVLP